MPVQGELSARQTVVLQAGLRQPQAVCHASATPPAMLQTVDTFAHLPLCRHLLSSPQLFGLREFGLREEAVAGGASHPSGIDRVDVLMSGIESESLIA